MRFVSVQYAVVDWVGRAGKDQTCKAGYSSVDPSPAPTTSFVTSVEEQDWWQFALGVFGG